MAKSIEQPFSKGLSKSIQHLTHTCIYQISIPWFISAFVVSKQGDKIEKSLWVNLQAPPIGNYLHKTFLFLLYIFSITN